MSEKAKKAKRIIYYKTLCCGFEWDNKSPNPLKLKTTGAECTKCLAPYLLNIPIECDKCGCTEMLCGAFGVGCSAGEA